MGLGALQHSAIRYNLLIHKGIGSGQLRLKQHQQSALRVGHGPVVGGAPFAAPPKKNYSLFKVVVLSVKLTV